jgi:hypothetical protein
MSRSKSTFDDANLFIIVFHHLGILHGGVQRLRPVIAVRLRGPALIPAAVPEAAVAPNAGVQLRLALVVVGTPKATGIEFSSSQLYPGVKWQNR